MELKSISIFSSNNIFSLNSAKKASWFRNMAKSVKSFCDFDWKHHFDYDWLKLLLIKRLLMRKEKFRIDFPSILLKLIPKKVESFQCVKLITGGTCSVQSKFNKKIMNIDKSWFNNCRRIFLAFQHVRVKLTPSWSP